MLIKNIFFNLFFSFLLFDFCIPSYSAEILSENENIVISKNNLDYQNDEYLVGPGDVIKISFLYAPELSGQYKILSNGSLPLPYVGNIEINFIPLSEVKNLLYREFSKKILRADLNMSLVVYRPIKISIIGEVNKPGIYTFQSGKENDFPTIVSALEEAGGVNVDTNLREIKVIRRLPGIGQERKIANIDLVDLIIEGNQSQNIYLQDRDIISLSKTNDKDLEFTELSSSNLFPSVINVNIIGSVYAPGRQSIESNTSLVQAIMQAGGPRQWRTNTGNIELIRVNKNGTAFRKRYKISLLETVSNENNPILQHGDLIKVNPNLLNNITTGLGAMTEPLASILNAVALIKLID